MARHDRGEMDDSSPVTARDDKERCMARKRSAREEADTSKPRQLRKRLRKAEDQLADAVQKRDRAQARVEALGIIADEIRAQLAETEKAAAAAEQEATSAAEQEEAARSEPAKPSRPARKATGRARVSPGSPPVEEAPAVDSDGAAPDARTTAARPARKAAAGARKRVTLTSGPSAT
jgi:hypothetical protein